MHYDPKLRPAQPATPAPDAFVIHRREVPRTAGRDGVSLVFVHEGLGGYPLVLLHGYPETKRIWWRNISALADAGYEVIAPDLRGYGDSDLSAADVYDPAAWSRDVYLLVHDVLGHGHCGVVGGDLGGVVGVDLLHRYPGFVDKLVFFDSVPPFVFDDFAAAGIDVAAIRAIGDGPTSDYRYLQGATPDELAAELDTPAKRRRYVAGMYCHRMWASPGTFSATDVDFMTEPFATEDRMRAGWAAYQLAHGRPVSEPPMLDKKVDVPTLISLRHGRPCRRPRLSDHLRGGIHRPHRPSRFARGRAFFAVGERRLAQPAGHRVFRRRARSPGAIGMGRP